MYSWVIPCPCQLQRTDQWLFGCVNQTLHFLVSISLFAKFDVVKAYVPMLGNTWIRLTGNIEYLDNGGSLESRVWVQFVNSWDVWLRDGLGCLIHKLFLMCCFTLPFLWCPYFSIEVIVPLLDTCCCGVGEACWDREPLGKGWRFWPGWDEGWGSNWGAPASRANGKRGGSLQFRGSWFPGGRWWKPWEAEMGQCSSLSSAVCAALLQPSLLLTLS